MNQNHKTQLLAAKFHAWTSVGWGLIVVFLVLGAMSGRAQVAAGGAVIMTVMWTLIKIGREALDAVIVLRAIRLLESEPEESKDEDS